jgi:serine/threonine protein kinase/tetratricopeptide (TPR) repeat protein
MDEASIFLAALQQPSPDGRAAFLDQACGGNGELRRNVEMLLLAHVRAGDFLAQAPAPVGATVDLPVTEAPGTLIGPYKLLEQIGEGGFGVVFMAEQTQPVRRKVALKVIKPGMDTKQVVARFEAERQALALMDHPNIARIFDGGATASGRPYFVMELVKGVPVTEYCDRQRLTTRRRLELFLSVCRAVQHAHQKGVIHRDLKPSNVLVAVHDVTPVTKVIDFGIAKAAGPQLTDKTLFTGFAQLVGTPLYMSPEQAGQSSLDVDTRSDVYSLGVLLYELLTGTTPFGGETLRQAGYDEMRRIIREEEPPRPSTRLSTLEKGSLATICERRGAEPGKLCREVRGELDWVVMKALEKDRDRRYESASALAADVQRYLDDAPVLACPPSAGYRLQKFARRNRTALTTVGAVALALLLGTAVSTWQAVEANAARRVSDKHYRWAREAVDQMLSEVGQERLRDVPSMEPVRRELLEKALAFYQKFLQEQGTDPAVRQETGRAYLRVGDIQLLLGQKGEAREAHRQAVALFAQLANDFPGNPEYRQDLGHGYYAQILAHEENLPQVEQSYRSAIAVQEQLVADFPDVPAYQSDLAKSYLYWGHDLKINGTRIREAETALRRSLQMVDRLLEYKPLDAGYRADLGAILGNLSGLLRGRDDWQEAEQMCRRALSVRSKLAEEFPKDPVHRRFLADAHLDLGTLLRLMGRDHEAAEHCRAALAEGERLVADFPKVPLYACYLPYTFSQLVPLLANLGQAEEAKQACAKWRAFLEKLHDDSPSDKAIANGLADMHHALGDVLKANGELEEAEQAYRKALALVEPGAADYSAEPQDRRSLAEDNMDLAGLLWLRVKHMEGDQVYRKGRALYEKLIAESPELHLTARYHQELAWFLATYPGGSPLREPGRAVQLARKATELARQEGNCWQTLGVAHYRAGDWNAAVEALEKSLPLRCAGDSWSVSRALEKSLPLRCLGKSEVWFFLAMAHGKLGHQEQAGEWYAQAVRWMEKNQPKNPELRRLRAEAATVVRSSNDGR